MRLIAELSNNHNGDFDRCIRLIDAAKSAGATDVKFQCYTPDDLVALRGDGPAPEPWGSEGWSMRDLYEKAKTPLDWFPALYAHARDIGVNVFSSVFGPDGLECLESVDNPEYKVASLDHRSEELWRLVGSTGKPTMASAPDFRAPLIADTMLYCPPGYPQKNIRLRHITNGYHGLSYHGTNELVPLAALCSGAKVVECHFMLEPEPSELEAGVSLTEKQFADLAYSVHMETTA